MFYINLANFLVLFLFFIIIAILSNVFLIVPKTFAQYCIFVLTPQNTLVVENHGLVLPVAPHL